MKSIEEASRAVAGLNGQVMPHVSPQVSHPGPPPPRLVAAIWREEHYLALMSKENMRAYADSMRKASTWYERQTKSGFLDARGERMPCRFFALGRGCIFANNCGFSHEREPPPYVRGPVNTHSSAGGPGFGPPLSKPQRLLPSPAFEPGSDARVGVPPLSYRQERIPVLDEDGQSPALTFVRRDEVDARSGLKAAYPGNAVGVAMPWQPEHGAGSGGASAADKISPHPVTSKRRSADREQPRIGRDSSKALGNSEPQRDEASRTFAAARANPQEGNENNRGSGYPDNSRSRKGHADGDSGGGTGRGDDGRSVRDSSRTGSDRRLQRGGRTEAVSGARDRKNRSRERGDRRDRLSSPVSSRSKSPRRSSGGFEKSGRSKVSARDSGRQRGRSNRRRDRSDSYESTADRRSRKQRRDSRSRRSNSRENAGDRGAWKHRRDGGGRRSNSHGGPADRGARNNRRDISGRRNQSHDSPADRGSRKYRRDGGGRQQRRASPSSTRRRRHGDDSNDRHRRSTTRRDRSRGSFSPVGLAQRYEDNVDRARVKARRYDGESADYDMDGRRNNKIRYERGNDRGRSRDLVRREYSGEEHDSFFGRGGTSDSRREDISVNHGWVSLANDPGGFSQEGGRQSFGVSPRRGSGSVPFRDGRYLGDDSESQFGSGDWNNGFIQPELPARPVKTQFTVTARLGSLHAPPIRAPAAPASPRHPTMFSITVPPSMTSAIGPTSPSGGVRRGGRPARGRGRGGRFGNQRDAAGRRPPRGHQYDNAEHNQDE